MAGTGYQIKSDLYSLFDYVSNTGSSHCKELIIETLREFFSQDSYYHYQRDEWGFPKTPTQEDLNLGAGLHDDLTTRLFIGEKYRQDVIFYPALLVKFGGSRSVPISMNREKSSVQWAAVKYVDGYGHESIISTPTHFIQAGAWEGSINIDIQTRSLKARDELGDLIALAFVDTYFEDLVNSGVVVKGVSRAASSEGEDRYDKLFTETITLDIRSEWRRHIPVTTILDAIHICVDFGVLTETGQIKAPNLSITTEVNLTDAIVNL